MRDESLFLFDNIRDLVTAFNVPGGTRFKGFKVTSFCDNRTAPIISVFYVDSSGNDVETATNRSGCPYPPHCLKIYHDRESFIKCFEDQLKEYGLI